MEKSPDRLKILEKIEDYEKRGLFDIDVEDDPPTITLMPDKVDYLNKKLSNKIMTSIMNSITKKFFQKQEKKKNIIIKEVIGEANAQEIKGGAIITCNHFNAFDNYALSKAILKNVENKNLYKVIREGNFTSFPGFYGKVFKHCNTLPLSSNKDTMKLFLRAVKTLLARGEKIVIYPEQAMWWNYKKPRPLKDGAFHLAVENNVPVLPCFITMTDSNILGQDGFYVQEYHVHILKAIYPNENMTKKENIQKMKEKNFEMWKEVYENFYKVKLTYNREK